MKGFLLLIVVLSFTLISCSDSVPKSKAYPRIERKQSELDTFAHKSFSFLYPSIAKIEEVKKEPGSSVWFNVNYTVYDATLYCTYLSTTKSQISHLLDESYRQAYNHAAKAKEINQMQFVDSLRRVFGMLYDIKGDVASSVQFYATDNETNYFRGALYFNREIKVDSVSPVVGYIREDIVRMMETLKWMPDED